MRLRDRSSTRVSTHASARNAARDSARDEGFTLPELLIAMVVSGILVVSISMAFTTVLQTQGSATTRLAESKDITFVQTWLPVDLSSALEVFDMAPEADLLTALAAVKPASMAYTSPDPTQNLMPGTNVLTVVRPDLETGDYYLVAYRYHQVGGQWQISRFEIRNPGQPSQVVKTVGVAHEIPAPPEDWNWETDQPTHAVEVLTRNGAVLRPVGEDVTVYFESNNSFTTGGAGLSAENKLPTDYSGGFVDPSAPPSRCGGRIAVIVDTSGSVPASGGGVNTEQAVAGFIDGFTGTPTSLSLNGFDREGYGMVDTGSTFVTNGVRAPFVSLLNDGPAVAKVRARAVGLDDTDNKWNSGKSTKVTPNKVDPDAPFGIHWDQIGSGTNWEDGMWTVFRQSDGTSYGLDQPDLVVFITDGDPTFVRTAAGGWRDVLAGLPAPNNSMTAAQKKTAQDNRDAAQKDAAMKAAAVADYGRGLGAEVIGIMVGNNSKVPKFVDWLKLVVGPKVWDGTVRDAAIADVFASEFDQLGTVLRSIMIAECGGTITLQKRIETPTGLENPPSGVWSYTTDLGVSPLDVSKASSLTFDYSFADGVLFKDVSVIEQAATGYVFDRAECRAGGTPVTSTPNADGSPGVTVRVQADQAVSCLMISRPA